MVPFRNLILFLNNICDVGCDSCNVNAAPKNKQLIPDSILHDIFRLDGSKLPSFVILTGGEPFNSFEKLSLTLCNFHKMGKQIEILSSGSWFLKKQEYLKELIKNGSFSLRISLDAEHNERIQFDKILQLVELCLSLKIEINFTLRKIDNKFPDPEFFKNKLLRLFPDFKGDSRKFHQIPHFPIRAHRKDQKPELIGNRWKLPCPQILHDLVIGADGQIYPCCGIFQNSYFKSYSLGELTKSSINSLEERFKGKAEIDILRKYGPIGILEYEKIRIEDLKWLKIVHTCDLCFAIWNYLQKKNYPETCKEEKDEI